MDNPLVKFGSDVYQPGQPINLTYDAFGPPAALVRGVFEYLYRAYDLQLIPHIPPTISRLEQLFPIRFGAKRLYLATIGSGPITAVRLNRKPWPKFDAQSVVLPYDEIPQTAAIEIALGGAQPRGFGIPRSKVKLPPAPPLAQLELLTSPTNQAMGQTIPPLRAAVERARQFHQLLEKHNLTDTYEAAHARLAIESLAVAQAHQNLLAEGKLKPLANPVSQAAANQAYLDAARKITDGLAQVLSRAQPSPDPQKQFLARLWQQSADMR
jgi:hypothetical protein